MCIRDRGSAIRTVFGAIHDGGATNDVIAIRYLQALEAISDGHANKVFLPMEVTGILGSLGGIAELFKDDRGHATTPAPPSKGAPQPAQQSAPQPVPQPAVRPAAPRPPASEPS